MCVSVCVSLVLINAGNHPVPSLPLRVTHLSPVDNCNPQPTMDVSQGHGVLLSDLQQANQRTMTPTLTPSPSVCLSVRRDP